MARAAYSAQALERRLRRILEASLAAGLDGAQWDWLSHTQAGKAQRLYSESLLALGLDGLTRDRFSQDELGSSRYWSLVLDDPDPLLEVGRKGGRRQLSRKASYLAKSEPPRRAAVAPDASGTSRQVTGEKKVGIESSGLGFWGGGDEIDREGERRREERRGKRGRFKWEEGVVRGGMGSKGEVGKKLLIGKERECEVCGKVYEVRRGDKRRVGDYCGQRCREVGKEEERSYGEWVMMRVLGEAYRELVAGGRNFELVVDGSKYPGRRGMRREWREFMEWGGKFVVNGGNASSKPGPAASSNKLEVETAGERAEE